MTTTPHPAPAGPRSDPAPAPAEGVTRVAHQGGPRNGTVAEVATASLSRYLVYDGPRWIGVYVRTDPPRSLATPDGPAQVWVSVHG